ARARPRAPGCGRRRSPARYELRPLGRVAYRPAEVRELVAARVRGREIARAARLLALGEQALGFLVGRFRVGVEQLVEAEHVQHLAQSAGPYLLARLQPAIQLRDD